jgi:hypothetical protein
MEAKGNQNDAVTKKDCRAQAAAAARAMGRFRQTHRHNDPEKSVVRLILSKTESQKLEAQMKCAPSSSKEYRDANINANTFTFFILFMGHHASIPPTTSTIQSLHVRNTYSLPTRSK